MAELAKGPLTPVGRMTLDDIVRQSPSTSKFDWSRKFYLEQTRLDRTTYPSSSYGGGITLVQPYYTSTATNSTTYKTVITPLPDFDFKLEPEPKKKPKRKRKKMAMTQMQSDLLASATRSLEHFSDALKAPYEQISEEDIDLDMLPAFAASNELYSKTDLDEMQESGETGVDPVGTSDILKANLISSRVTGYRKHRILLDIDHEAALIPSSTEGHYHLYINHLLTDEQMEKLVKVLEEIELIAPGNANQWWRHKALFLRLPWIKKRNENASSEGN
jgi:hypothetical protein